MVQNKWLCPNLPRNIQNAFIDKHGRLEYQPLLCAKEVMIHHENVVENNLDRSQIESVNFLALLCIAPN